MNVLMCKHFQINHLDKTRLIKQQLRRNKYRNMLTLLFGFLAIISATSIAFSITGKVATVINHYEHYSYTTAMLSTASELLLIGELTTQLTNKFSILNSHIYPKTVLFKKIDKTYPLSKLQTQKVDIIVPKLVAVMETHNHLSVISRRLNNIFGFPILIIITVNFYLLTISLFYALQLLSLSSNIISTFQMTASLVWCVILIFEIFILSRCFENLSEKVST